jgi:tryptophanyl-tRNA synthetase
MSKPVILTGLRANNDLHLGNYLGALLPMVDMAKRHAGTYQINLFIPDLHSFTTPIDHSKLQEQIRQNIRVFVAAGLPLEDADIHIYRQSHIPAHSELTVIRISVGLFDYPVLMAADILLYGATYVPVGDDQTQHLEFTRDIAERMNNKFGNLFIVPKAVKEQHEFFGKDQGLRIRDLVDPTKKMSKSDETGKGVIFLSDTPDEARKKIMSATTDSETHVRYNYEKQPGISNLLDILVLLGGKKEQFLDEEQYGALKTAVANEVDKFLTDFQTKLSAVDDTAIEQKLTESESLMNKAANITLYKAQQAVGLR